MKKNLVLATFGYIFLNSFHFLHLKLILERKAFPQKFIKKYFYEGLKIRLLVKHVE